MATIRLTILSSIKEHDGRLPILVCISQKKERAYIKTEFLLDDIAEFDNGKVAYRKDANVMNKRLEFSNPCLLQIQSKKIFNSGID